MMTTVEILKEIKKLPYGKRREISKELEYILKEENRDSREREMAEHLFEQGIIDQIPDYAITDEEYDEIELLEVEGEPISEQVIRERI